MADAEEILIIKGRRLLLPDCITPGCIIVKNGKIAGIERRVDTTHLSSRVKVRRWNHPLSIDPGHVRALRGVGCRFYPYFADFFRSRRKRLVDLSPKLAINYRGSFAVIGC